MAKIGLSVTLDLELVKKLEKEAKRQEVKVSFLVNKMLKENIGEE